MARGPRLKKEEYDFINLLIAKDQSTDEICRRVMRSPDTVRCVKYSTDYDDFLKTPTKELRKRRKQEDDHQISVDEFCQHIESNQMIIPEANEKENDPDDLKIRVSLEIGETARKAIDGLLALVGVRA